MTYQEKRIVASIGSSLLLFGIYYATVIQMFQNGRFAGDEATALLGKSILLLIVGGIIINIIMAIVSNIVIAIVNNEPKPSFVVDERDKLIELRGLRISFYITSVGVIVSMGALALGRSTFLAFNLIVASFALGDLISNILMLHIYRRGF